MPTTNTATTRSGSTLSFPIPYAATTSPSPNARMAFFSLLPSRREKLGLKRVPESEPEVPKPPSSNSPRKSLGGYVQGTNVSIGDATAHRIGTAEYLTSVAEYAVDSSYSSVKSLTAVMLPRAAASIPFRRFMGSGGPTGMSDGMSKSSSADSEELEKLDTTESDEDDFVLITKA